MAYEVLIWDMGMLCKYFYVSGGMTYGGVNFARAIRKFAEEQRTARVILCADTPKTPTWRHRIFPQYKANRADRKPEEQAALEQQFADACSSCSDIATVLQLPGWEADDLVATAMRRVIEEGVGALVVSADKDLAQLLEYPIRLYDGRFFVEPSQCMGRFGVPPHLVGDYLALAGDACDGIPGVRGLGPRAAKNLLTAYGSLEAAIHEAERDASTGMLRILAGAKETARLSRRLTALDFNAPISMPWD